ncbi:LysR substrate-binding domain-containing protein [Phyllobacterium sp. 21LDTY02-6]|uniref:LysR substrate-binding domain-containing protein n=1 Tax=Phyllobacterium sp. 21LDTY02-6 TaxID=2944903 RepID=UPI0020216F06|nr:LysR substrate-binding domain-containing protein [Phyllobacterium sp. 21LDTY02-6]MCO4319494.1 LysR substrate-binding domain-containing protein [Phyllobacterium sp. 21LDTY02-6]
MDIRSLECFIVVAEELHFHRAAARLNITQPALSQRIRALEHEVGVALLERDRRSVSVTAAGSAFLGPARTALASARNAGAEALRAARGEVGRLRLGFTVIAFYGFLPEAVRVFRERHPDVLVELAEMNSPSLEAALVAGSIDIAMLHPPIEMPGLSLTAMPSQRLVLAMPANHPLAASPVVSVKDIGGAPFLAAPRHIGPHFYDRVIAMFREQDVALNIVQEVSPMTTLAGLVAAGAGMGFVTEGIAALRRPGIVYKSVTPQPPELPLAAAWMGKEPTAVSRRFMAVVDELAWPATP